jgi:tagatose-1,6-bisphosphate aldolase
VNSLDRLARPDGVFCMLARGHRDARWNAFRRAGAEDACTETMLELKARIATADCCKLLLSYRADHGATAARQRALVARGRGLPPARSAARARAARLAARGREGRA